MPPTPRKGRPQKLPRFRRTSRVQILLTPAEHQALTAYAQARDTTVSDLLRNHIKSLLAEAGGA